MERRKGMCTLREKDLFRERMTQRIKWDFRWSNCSPCSLFKRNRVQAGGNPVLRSVLEDLSDGETLIHGGQ